ncbi:alpha/beta hydrolase [Azoarcus sp. L1K30]|uniref:alpha/beta hydrolase n=1 Tax=Azoarcus sp. L1K30 TaxID=2820277 RepID=UPI001B811EB7|nr:alpha/beta hydrolase [Azoarcus sp. L1K30]MBR0567479.1 alpha/beta hydrolase [Azoarcus sp. L1K30]
MFIVTNREVDETKTTVKDAFKPYANARGPNELRLAEAVRDGSQWRIRILPDEITDEMAAEVGLTHEIDPDTGDRKPLYASAYVARRIVERVNPRMLGGKEKPKGKAKSKGRNLVFFVHGFNNNVEAVLDRAEQLEQLYGVEVLPFTWPANGGGVKGVVSYLSDKRDALASTGAFDRCLGKLEDILNRIHEEHVQRVEALANARYANKDKPGLIDAEQWDNFFTRESQKWCPFSVSMMLHSMGNYLFKQLLKSTVYRGNRLLFDNVVMVAADANNENHAEWVDRIQCRGRIFITINERDSALLASRMKVGEQQLARLGHYPYKLDSRQAVYVDFTNQPHVGSEHAYFEGDPVKNPQVKQFFDEALNGEFAESGLKFDIGRNMYRLS